MPDPFRGYRPGDASPKDAGSFNAFAMAARLARDSGKILSANPLGSTRSGDIIRVKNASGADLDRFAVVGLDEPVFLPSTHLEEFKREVVFSGVTPTSSHVRKFAVLLEPAANDDRVVRAIVAGVVQVQVDVSVTAHEYAQAKASTNNKLESSGDGPAQILWRETGTGVKWAIVRLGAQDVGTRLAKITGGGIAAVASNVLASGTCRLYYINGSATRVDSGTNITAYNPSSSALADTSWIFVAKIDGRWVVTNKLDC